MRSRPSIKLIVFLVVFPMVFICSPGYSQQFSSSDMEGTWHYMGLISGDSPAQKPGWYYGDFTFDQNGKVVSAGPVVNSLGNNDYTPATGLTFNISTEGLVTVPGIDYKGIMNDRKNMMISVATLCPGSETDVCGYNLQVFMKHPTSSFSPLDFEGSWHYMGLISGDSPAQKPGWYYGDFTFDQNGKVVGASPVTNSLGNNDYTPSTDLTFNISAEGSVTVPGIEYKGIMNDRKNMMFAVATLCPGSETDVCGYNLQVFVKRSAITFSPSDLAGRWNNFGLTSGDSSQFQWTGWHHSFWLFDKDGNLSGSTANSSGNTYNGVSVSGDGFLSYDNSPSFHGVMSGDKDFIVMFLSNGGGGYAMIPSVKRKYNLNADINLDGHIGLEDAIFPLQIISGVRSE